MPPTSATGPLPLRLFVPLNTLTLLRLETNERDRSAAFAPFCAPLVSPVPCSTVLCEH